MDFGRDETQRAVAQLAADVLRNETAEPEGAFDEQAWAALAKVGLLSLALPESLGGDALGFDAVAVILTEVGRAAAELPALPTLALGVMPVVRYGSPEQHAALLPDVAAGTTLLTAAVSEPGEPLTSRPSTTAAAGRLTGTKACVPYAEQAHRVLVPASTDDGCTVFLVNPRGDGVALARTPTSSGAPEFTVRLDGAPGEPLGGADAVAALRQYALAGAAAQGYGALAGALDLTTEHLRTRHQFGKPLAAFQAVAQQVADVYVAARTVELAAISAADGNTADADLAAYWLTSEALPAMRTCHHLHGGIGLDVTYPLHRYYSQLKDLTRALGGSAQRLAALEV